MRLAGFFGIFQSKEIKHENCQRNFGAFGSTGFSF